MSGIQYSSLSDDEFERQIYASIGAAGALPDEIVKELLYRHQNGGRDKEKSYASLNKQQQELPLN